MSHIVILLKFITTFSLFHYASGQLLTAEYLDAKLPIRNRCPRPFHVPGDSHIYIFGGSAEDGISRNEMFALSLATNTLVPAGQMPGNGRRGTVQADSYGNMYYVGGGQLHDTMFKFDPVTNRSTVAIILPHNVEDSTSIKYMEGNNTIIILGGDDDSSAVLALDLELLTYTELEPLGFGLNQGTSVHVGNKAYIFDDGAFGTQRQALELDLDTFRLMSVGPSTLPEFRYWPSSVYDGSKFAYIVGGYVPNVADEEVEVMTPTGGLIQFDTVTFENSFIAVRNLPVEGLSYYVLAPGSVYVSDLNRIYFFGGQSFNYTLNATVTHDEIFFIDLTPLNPTPPTSASPVTLTTIYTTPSVITTTPQASDPTTRLTTLGSSTGLPPTSTTLNPDLFSCSGRPNGLYPHPTDCAMYIGCQDEQLLVFSCPPPLLFDPVRKACDFPDVVDCNISCDGKPDGSYPHPHDCSLYIMCRASIPNVFRCPPPLLFDPVGLNCAFPDDVQCNVFNKL